MTIYIAAPYPERDYAVRVMEACEARGIIVTSRWLKAPDELADAFAREDLADVAAADWLVALNPSKWADKGTGGRHVELGYALALGKRVALVGGRSNIFHYLSDIIQIDNTEPAAIATGLAHVRASRAGGRAMNEDICPNCGGELEYDEVDIGVGIQRGNPGCPDCHWTPPPLVLDASGRCIAPPQDQAQTRVDGPWRANCDAREPVKE